MSMIRSASQSGCGVWITSGILEGKESLVAQAMREAGLELIGEEHQGEWACLIARKN